MSLRQAIKKAGYSQSTADTPSRITKTKTWEELLDQYLPDKLLTRVAKQGLKSTTYRDINGRTEEIPDRATQQRYLETALKMRGKLTDKVDVTSNGKVVEFKLIAPDK